MPRAIAHLSALALACALAPGALAAAGTGGTSATPVPKISSVTCRSDCAGVTSARPASTVRIAGKYLDTVETVVFLGAKGAADDVEARPREGGSGWLDVAVPRSAVTGRVAVVNVDGAQSRRSKRARLRIGPAAQQRSQLRSAAGPAIEVEMQGQRVFFDAARKATLVYMLSGSAPADVGIDLVRLGDGVVVAHWDVADVAPGAPQTVTWDGTSPDGALQKEGRYEFRVFAQDAQGMTAQSAQAEDEGGPGAFTFLKHKFPVRGAHGYGEFQASFGGGRGHKGHDVFARCGTPLVAARGGTVKHRASHSRAGNYVVIDGEATGVDYVYMHLRNPAKVRKGDRVRTGQLIGHVGDTGRASGCHLHFELWSAPGWYTGGSAFDPLPSLRAWDANS